MRLNLNSLEVRWQTIIGLFTLVSLLVVAVTKGRAMVDIPRQLFVHDSIVTARDRQGQVLEELRKMNCYIFADHTKGDWHHCEDRLNVQ